MKKIKKNNFFFLFYLIAICNIMSVRECSSKSPQNIISIDNKIKNEKDNFQLNLLKLQKTKRDKFVYNINSQRDDLKLFLLIKQLENLQTKESNTFIQTINNLYSLEFFKFINQIKIKESFKIDLTSAFYKLYQQELSIQTEVTKSLLQASIVNNTFSMIFSRKTSIRLILENLKYKLLKKIDAKKIKNLSKKEIEENIKLLQKYLPRPVISKTTKIIIFSAATVISTILAIKGVKILLKKIENKIDEKFRNVNNAIQENIQIMGKQADRIVQTTGIQINETMQNGIQKFGEQANKIVQTSGGQLNIMVETAGNQIDGIVKNQIDGIVKNSKQLINQTEITIKKLARNIDQRTYNRIKQTKNINPFKNNEYKDIPDPDGQKSEAKRNVPKIELEEEKPKERPTEKIKASKKKSQELSN